MRENYLVVNSLKLIREILSALYMLLIGLCMKHSIKIINVDPRSFLYFVFANGFFALFFHIWRRIVEARENREREALQEEEMRKNSDSEF